MSFEIAGRQRAHANKVAGPSDFELTAAGPADTQAVLENPYCSLYCLDSKKRNAIFVETPLDIDIYDEAFLYQAQHRHATRVFAVPYEEFIRSAQERVGPGDNLLIIYSVGRCGSTLLTRAFHQFDEVLTMSEPDAPIQLIDALGDPEATALLKSAVALLCKPAGSKKPSHYVIKLRAQGIHLAKPLLRLFPSAKTIFMYRNADDVVKSYLRAFHPLPPSFPDYHKDPVAFFARFWAGIVQGYLTLHEEGLPIRAVRYEELIAQPRAIFQEIVRWSGMPLGDVTKAEVAFATDAQEGSNISREKLKNKPAMEFGSEEQMHQKVCQVIEGYPAIGGPDPVLPGTLIPGSSTSQSP